MACLYSLAADPFDVLRADSDAATRLRHRVGTTPKGFARHGGQAEQAAWQAANPIHRNRLMIDDPPAYQKTDFAMGSFVIIVFIMSATDVIRELEELPSQEREKVLRWLQQQGLKDLWARADALMKDAPKVSEDEILRLPRVRPSGF